MLFDNEQSNGDTLIAKRSNNGAGENRADLKDYNEIESELFEAEMSTELI